VKKPPAKRRHVDLESLLDAIVTNTGLPPTSSLIKTAGLTSGPTTTYDAIIPILPLNFEDRGILLSSMKALKHIMTPQLAIRQGTRTRRAYQSMREGIRLRLSDRKIVSAGMELFVQMVTYKKDAATIRTILDGSDISNLVVEAVMHHVDDETLQLQCWKALYYPCEEGLCSDNLLGVGAMTAAKQVLQHHHTNPKLLQVGRLVTCMVEGGGPEVVCYYYYYYYYHTPPYMYVDIM